MTEAITKNFSTHEVECHCGCGFGAVSPDLMMKLQNVRDSLGSPMKLTSVCRCEFHNKGEGGSPASSHLHGKAADIAIPSSAYRSKILPLLMRSFCRVGIGKDFIHVDTDNTKDQYIVWVYPSLAKNKFIKKDDNV